MTRRPTVTLHLLAYVRDVVTPVASSYETIAVEVPLERQAGDRSVIGRAEASN